MFATNGATLKCLATEPIAPTETDAEKKRDARNMNTTAIQKIVAIDGRRLLTSSPPSISSISSIQSIPSIATLRSLLRKCVTRDRHAPAWRESFFMLGGERSS